ncbi:MAG: Clp1/GlmU family protein [Armatimonadota bacterium]
MPVEMLKSWEPHVADVLARPGVTVVVGDVDAGKTSFVSLLSERAIAAGVRAAVVDGDIGQSEIGPPTTVGLADAGETEPRALYFVGDTSPVGHLLALATGVKKLADRAGAELTIVDTTGFVRGATARKLKTQKIELLSARHVIALQRGAELEHFLRLFDAWSDCTVHRLSPSPHARAKSRTLRAQRRAVRFHQYFSEAEEHALSLALPTSGTWLSSGTPMEPRLAKFAEKELSSPVLHGEVLDPGVFLVVQGDYNRRGIEKLAEHFGTKSVVVVPAGRYRNLLVGLHDEHLSLLSLGILTEIDFRAQTARVETPLRSIAPVRVIRFGSLKVRLDGTEIGRLRPGEY